MAAHCGAKTRSGGRCKKPAGWGTKHPGSGRCRLHGGCSTGPPKGSKNALTTGEYESIIASALDDDDERILYAQVRTDKLIQLDEEIRLLTIRERRMLRRITYLREIAAAGDKVPKGATDPELGMVPIEAEQSGRVGSDRVHMIVRSETAIEVIQRIEQALTRVQMVKVRLIALKHQIESGGGSLDGTLRDLTAAVNRSRDAIE